MRTTAYRIQLHSGKPDIILHAHEGQRGHLPILNAMTFALSADVFEYRNTAVDREYTL